MPRARRASGWLPTNPSLITSTARANGIPFHEIASTPGDEAPVHPGAGGRPGGDERHDVVAVSGGSVLLDEERQGRDAALEAGRADVAGVGVAEAGEHVSEPAVDGRRWVDAASSAEQAELLDRVGRVAGALEREVGVELVDEGRSGVHEQELVVGRRARRSPPRIDAASRVASTCSSPVRSGASAAPTEAYTCWARSADADTGVGNR